MSRCMAKIMHLDLLKQPTIWNEGVHGLISSTTARGRHKQIHPTRTPPPPWQHLSSGPIRLLFFVNTNTSISIEQATAFLICLTRRIFQASLGSAAIQLARHVDFFGSRVSSRSVGAAMELELLFSLVFLLLVRISDVSSEHHLDVHPRT